jgi:hypothetical protein
MNVGNDIRDAESEPTTGVPGAAVVLPTAGDGQAELAELTRQWSLDSLNVVGTQPAERFDRITRLAKQALGVEVAAISLIDHDRQWFKSHTGGHSGAEGPRDEAFCAHTIQRPEGLVVTDARTDELVRENPHVVSGMVASYAGYPLLGPGGERVGALCVYGAESREFTPTDLRLLRDLAQWVQDELAAEADLSRGVQVQQGLLPSPLVSLAGYQVAGASRPVRSISGDFYDWYPTVGGAAFTFGGVMAKSVVAALIAATVRATMRAAARTDGAAAAVENAADTLDADLDGAGVFVTLFHGHLDEQLGVLRYVDAGHGLSVVVHADGSTERLDPTGPPLGAGWENVWEERTVHLRPADVFVSVSDGVLDAFGGTLDALARVGALARGATSAEQVVAAIVAAAGAAADDLTVMAVRRNDVIGLER